MNTAPRNQSIELSFERLLLLIQDMQAAIGRLQQPSASSGGGQQSSPGVSPLYFATNSSSVSAATGTTLAGLTPNTFTSTVYTNVGGSLVSQATSQTCYWWYLDTLPANSIVPVEPNAAGTGWDAIGGGCTAL